MSQNSKRYKTLEGAQAAAVREAEELGALIDVYSLLVKYKPRSKKEPYTYTCAKPIMQYFTAGSGYRQQTQFEVGRLVGLNGASIRRVAEMQRDRTFKAV